MDRRKLFAKYDPVPLSYMLLLILLGGTSAQSNFERHRSFVSMTQLNVMANYLEQHLLTFHKVNTQMNHLPSEDDRVPVKEIQPEKMIEVMELEISKFIEIKKNALEDMVSSLEEASRNYVWDDDLESDFTSVIHLNSSTHETFKDSPIVENEKFGVRINTSVSGVHLPLEIYEGYPQIVNGLKWASAVDTVFKKNYNRDPSLSWQFFAAQAGFMRIFPSVLSWDIPPPYNPVDLYDSKRRPWYIQTAVSPKDVIILMDRSGSVHGQTLTIMKFAIEILLDTLGENDFVNIAVFNETTHWVSEVAYEDTPVLPDGECLEYNHTLIQATNINKQALINDMQYVKDCGLSNYTDALRFAYETFKMRANEGDTGSNCLKTIMMFTDGGTDWPESILDSYVNDTDTEDVRIFTYAIGPHPIPVIVLKDMSCYTGGKLTTIMTSSGVRTKIQGSYFDVLSKPMALEDAHNVEFTSAYTSAVTNNVTVTMTMAVFNKSKELENATLTGIAGIDIPVHHLNNLSPRLQIGPLGYSYIINHNGFVVLHPRLQSQPSYLQDPPHLDIMDLELNRAEIRNVRNQMIDFNTGSVVINKKVLIDSQYIVKSARLQYVFKPIEGTPYSLGMVVQPRSEYLDILHDLPPHLLDEDTTLLAPWNFCGTQPSGANVSHINQFVGESLDSCDRLLIRGLYWGHAWTNVMTKKWRIQPFPNDIFNKAVFTRFGYSAVFNNGEETDGEVPGEAWRDPGANPALKLAMLSNHLHIFPHRKGAFLSLPATVNSVTVAVAGVNVSSTYLDGVLQSAIGDGLMSNAVILLVDQSAHLIASSLHQNSSGMFLGRRWPLLLEKLTEAGIYEKEQINDFFALCDIKKPLREEATASATRLLFEPIKMFASTVWRFLMLFESLHYLSFVGLWSGRSVNAVHKAAGYNESCIIQHSLYHFTDKSHFSGNISCLGDSAQVHVVRLNQTNAVLIAVEESLQVLSCDGWTEKRLDEKVVVEAKELACRMPSYRKRPEQCYSVVPEKCSDAPKLKNSLHTLCSFAVILLVFR